MIWLLPYRRYNVGLVVKGDYEGHGRKLLTKYVMNKLYSLTVLYDLYYLPKWNKVIVIVKKLKLYSFSLIKKK